jgi:hypothetical protein
MLAGSFMRQLARAIVRLLLPARRGWRTETVKQSDERSTESADASQEHEGALPRVPLNWSSDGSPHDGSSWQGYPERRGPLPPTPSELFAAISGMLETIGAAGLTPTLVLIEPAEQFEIWQRWLARHAPRLGPHQRETMTGKQWAQIRALPFLDRRPYGLELATRLAALLGSAGSPLAHGHRDYCGHGLRAASGSYCLEVYEDGLPSRLVASWPDERS